MTHVVIRAGKNLIESVISKRSADEMKLKVGDKVSAVIKSTEVMLEKIAPAKMISDAKRKTELRCWGAASQKPKGTPPSRYALDILCIG
jgi:hypothetical protein